MLHLNYQLALYDVTIRPVNSNTLIKQNNTYEFWKINQDIKFDMYIIIDVNTIYCTVLAN